MPDWPGSKEKEKSARLSWRRCGPSGSQSQSETAGTCNYSNGAKRERASKRGEKSEGGGGGKPHHHARCSLVVTVHRVKVTRLAWRGRTSGAQQACRGPTGLRLSGQQHAVALRSRRAGAALRHAGPAMGDCTERGEHARTCSIAHKHCQSLWVFLQNTKPPLCLSGSRKLNLPIDSGKTLLVEGMEIHLFIPLEQRVMAQ